MVISATKEEGKLFSGESVCLYVVCLSAGLLKSSKWILMKFFRG